MTSPKLPVLLVGTGPMAVDYTRVLQGMAVPFEAIGRGAVSAAAFFEQTGVQPRTGGLGAYLTQVSGPVGSHAIVSVGVEALAETCEALLKAGVQSILLEKPGAMSLEALARLNDLANSTGATVFIAYNRRFYASVQAAKELIAADGGLEAVHFEFTEWSHRIAPLQKGAGVKENWFLANSTHVADIGFFFAGLPKEYATFVRGGNDWHPSGTVFTGAGATDRGVLFSYQAHWESAGRWAVELLTKRYRYYLKPLEALQRQATGTLAIEDVVIDDTIDKQYKPGLYKQVAAWLEGQQEDLCLLSQQMALFPVYMQMAAYKAQ